MKPPAGTPPWSVTDDDRRRQTPVTIVWLPYTIPPKRRPLPFGLWDREERRGGPDGEMEKWANERGGVPLSRLCRCCVGPSDCWLQEIRSANSDAAYTSLPNYSEESCACYCVLNPSQCVAADYNIPDRSCSLHSVAQGTVDLKPYKPTCLRFEYTCTRKYLCVLAKLLNKRMLNSFGSSQHPSL